MGIPIILHLVVTLRTSMSYDTNLVRKYLNTAARRMFFRNPVWYLSTENEFNLCMCVFNSPHV
eukprot:SAG31_NODE_4560_length_3137_cov_7.770244_4_plen_63_part_00